MGNSDSISYHLHVLEIKTLPGFDTKKELKKIVGRTDDGTPLFEVESGKETVHVLATNRIQIWAEIQGGAATLMAREVFTSESFQATYISNEIKKNMQIMEAKKLIFCRQVELSSDEFIEDGGRVLLKANPDLQIGLDYIYTDRLRSTSGIRVCIHDYMPTTMTSSSTAAFKHKRMSSLYSQIMTSVVVIASMALIT